MSFFFFFCIMNIIISVIFFLAMPLPIYSLLLIIVLFINGTFLLFSIGLEFLPLLFLAVFLGAVIVLFLFAVMMLDIKEIPGSSWIHRIFTFRTFPVYLIFTFLLFVLFLIFDETYFFNKLISDSLLDVNNILSFNIDYFDFFQLLEDNKVSLGALLVGRLMFFNFIISFLIVGFIALLVMIGVILVSISENRLKSSLIQEGTAQSLRLKLF